MRTLALPDAVEQWPLTSLREKLIKIGAKIVRHGRYVTFQMAEVVIPRDLFADILDRAQTAASPGMSDGTPFLRVAADRIGAKKLPFRATNAANWSSIIGSARRWPSFEGELHVERFRATLNGLGGFHMGNPG